MIAAPATLAHNRELAAIFRQMARCYAYLGPEHRFRAIAYDNVAKMLANMPEPVDALSPDISKLEDIQGVGESIAHKIVEYLQTGRITTFEKLKQQVPDGLLSLMELEGFGPATVRLLHEQLGIDSKEELIQAIEAGRLEGIKGFGAKKIDLMRRVLKIEAAKQRLQLAVAQKLGNNLLHQVEQVRGIERVILAGSLRRQSETVGDIDMLVTAPHRFWKRIIEAVKKLPSVTRVLSAGPTKASFLVQPYDTQVDVRIVHPEEYGAALLYFTGNKAHNIQLRSMARQRGWKINEYGVYDEATGHRLAGNDEAGIYALFGLKCIPPEERLGAGELEGSKFRISQ